MASPGRGAALVAVRVATRPGRALRAGSRRQRVRVPVASPAGCRAAGLAWPAQAVGAGALVGAPWRKVRTLVLAWPGRVAAGRTGQAGPRVVRRVPGRRPAAWPAVMSCRAVQLGIRPVATGRAPGRRAPARRRPPGAIVLIDLLVLACRAWRPAAAAGEPVLVIGRVGPGSSGWSRLPVPAQRVARPGVVCPVPVPAGTRSAERVGSAGEGVLTGPPGRADVIGLTACRAAGVLPGGPELPRRPGCR